MHRYFPDREQYTKFLNGFKRFFSVILFRSAIFNVIRIIPGITKTFSLSFLNFDDDINVPPEKRGALAHLFK